MMKDEIGSLQDVEKRLLQQTAALRLGEEKYHQIINTVEEGVWLLDNEGKTTFVNDKMAGMLKYSPEAMIGKSLFDFMDEEGKEIAAANLKRREQGNSEHHDFKFRCQDGSDLWTIVSTNPIFNENGEFQGAIGMMTDVTERRQVQIDLERYARRLEVMREIDRAILEARAPIAVANEIIEQLQHLLPIIRASVLLIDWETYMGEVLASFSQMETQIIPGTRRPLADFGLEPELLSTDLIIRDDLTAVEDLSPVTEKLTEEGITCYIGVPMVSQGVVLGILYLAPANQREFSNEHLEIARELAHSLAVVIQQAKLTQQVQQHTRELEQRVIDRTAELQTANERLKELDRLKSKFVSDITHELRTPVTNMLLYLDLIRFNGPENQERYWQVLTEQVHRLRDLVEDSLDLSRLDVANKEVEFVSVALNSVIEQTVAEHRERAKRKGLDICYEPESLLPEVRAVQGKMERMVDSLLENAVNFTLAGEIQVSSALDEGSGTAVITFQDTGIGFTEEDLKHCFEPFYRGNRVGQLDIPGNGLGLALVQRIVDLHNGRIEIESEVDKGSTITIWLPRKSREKNE